MLGHTRERNLLITNNLQENYALQTFDLVLSMNPTHTNTCTAPGYEVV
jgi:hypothetical protein